MLNYHWYCFSANLNNVFCCKFIWERINDLVNWTICVIVRLLRSRLVERRHCRLHRIRLKRWSDKLPLRTTSRSQTNWLISSLDRRLLHQLPAPGPKNMRRKTSWPEGLVLTLNWWNAFDLSKFVQLSKSHVETLGKDFLWVLS